MALSSIASAKYEAAITYREHTIYTVEYVYIDNGPPPKPSALGNVFANGFVPFADGGVFGNITPFAKGGLPTNSVISSPMLFDMGLAGEAGPEAIMPLSRDSNGRLGVKAMGGTGANMAVAVSADNGSAEIMLALLEKVSALTEEVKGLRAEAQSTATSSHKTAKLLDRVIPDGRSLSTKVAV